MLIFGRKLGRREMPAEDASCPVCGESERHGVVAVRMHWHVYYVALGGGSLRGYEWTCSRCGMCRFSGSAGSLSEAIEQDAPSLTGRERRVAEIVRVLSSFEYMLHTQPERTSAESVGALAVGGFLLTAIPAAVGLSTGELWGWLFAGMSLLCLTYAVWHAITHKRRWAKKNLRVAIAQGFGRLRPTREEFAEAQAVLARSNLAVAGVFTPEELEAAAWGNVASLGG